MNFVTWHRHVACARGELHLVPPRQSIADDPDGRDRQHHRNVLLSILVLQPGVHEGEPLDQIVDAALLRGALRGVRLWRARKVAAAILLDDKIDVTVGDVACPYDIAAAYQIRETQSEVGVANVREGWRIRKLCRSYGCVIDRC